jgi:hypothetical protein
VLLVSASDPTLLWFLDRRGPLMADAAALPGALPAQEVVILDRRRIAGPPYEAATEALRAAGFVSHDRGAQVGMWTRAELKPLAPPRPRQASRAVSWDGR